MTIKDKVLVPRILYTTIGTLIPIGILELYGLNMIAGTALFIFIFSFIWQYFALHPTFGFVPSGSLRGLVLFVLKILAVVGIFSGLEFIYVIDMSETHVQMYELVGRMSLYIVSISLFIGLSCTCRALKLQKAL
ncbi:MAG: hypothetical protein RLZZ230_402 [Candidatus Parcubacteria bacterium]|jgi:hypothetical protein